MKAKWMIALLAAVATTGAVAGNTANLDANGDGAISAKEAQANPELAKQFDRLDANSNGKLEQGEFARFETRSQKQK